MAPVVCGWELEYKCCNWHNCCSHVQWSLLRLCRRLAGTSGTRWLFGYGRQCCYVRCPAFCCGPCDCGQVFCHIATRAMCSRFPLQLPLVVCRLEQQKCANSHPKCARRSTGSATAIANCAVSSHSNKVARIGKASDRETGECECRSNKHGKGHGFKCRHRAQAAAGESVFTSSKGWLKDTGEVMMPCIRRSNTDGREARACTVAPNLQMLIGVRGMLFRYAQK